jgi:hypothetical protein
VLVVAIPATASAQFGVIGVYTDQMASGCEIADGGQGVVNLYVVHTLGAGATAVQFKLQPSAGFGATFIGDTYPFELYLGNSQTGISIAYGDCLSGTVVVLGVTYLFLGSSDTCSYIDVVGDPAEVNYPGEPIVADCLPMFERAVHPIQGTRFMVNPDQICRCVLPVPVRESTWGQIKALYGG